MTGKDKQQQAEVPQRCKEGDKEEKTALTSMEERGRKKKLA